MIVCGVLDRCGQEIQKSELDELKRIISRDPTDQPQCLLYPGLAVASVNPGLSADALSISSDADSMAMIAGRAYLGLADRSAMDEAKAIRESLDRDDSSILRDSRGSYCGIHFNASTGRLRLFVDKIGVVPLYCGVSEKRVYFATALRILEGIAGLTRTLAIDHVAEHLAFSHCLGRGTPYEEIHSLYSGEILEVYSGELRSSSYWNWDDIQPGGFGSCDELIDSIDSVFESSIRIRLDHFGETVSFLSGGLDSRVITAKLRSLGRDVWTLNCAPAGTEDAEFGRLAAESLGTRHFHQDPQPGPFLAAQASIVSAWHSANAEVISDTVQPRRVWSGEGGSGVLGHVFLNETLIELCRQGDLRQAGVEFMGARRHIAPSGIFQRNLQQRVATAPLHGFLDEDLALQTGGPWDDSFSLSPAQ